MSQALNRSLLCFCIALAAESCIGAPNRDRAAEDLVKAIQASVGPTIRVAVEDAGPGEGDGSNVYMHVRFHLLSNKDTSFTSGCFAGLALSADRLSTSLEAQLLYQDTGRGPWVLTSTRLPCGVRG
jgi:hypothetical protein